ncbi:tetratricopeptide repeat protein [Nodularia sphaerocarpa]|uniref:tetratricopeptide repeat protein n=1 Tax=Nodularia sphaerocarpa TaxID=137816 RepID=UPI001EFB6817|nr:tetratricopeptide repeat protein [Nodularia sphaerocarpa]MDB9372601.1 tetratricopeptide repeat protein [Nodularia sphaerocarpa CS-585]MDB9379628.1 tetratricopeptide repeat protein [Nodularia sphaerocarpa CS-585A2]ULP71106.1 Photosystem I assembly protein Ycf3 [Nodularia sphaerocarpa UHCC 0038]
MTNPASNNIDKQNQDAYDDLIVSIEAGVGRLNLLIAVCDYENYRQEIISRYQAELQPHIRCYHVTLARNEPSLKAAIQQLVESEEYLQQHQPAVITVTGVEQLYFLRLGESQSEQEKFFGYLQWTREALREFPFAIVLWVTNQVLVNLIKKAPDFWSWRNGVFHFISKPKNFVHVQEFEPIRNILENGELSNLTDSKYSGIPIADLERLVEKIEQQDNHKEPKLLISLYLQLGDIYKIRLDKGEAPDYQQEQNLAIKYYLQAINLQTELGLETDLATSLNNLAYLYKSQGRYDEAEPLLIQALELRQRLLRDNHPDVATGLNNLALFYESQGRYDLAEPLYLQALELFKRHMGDNHPSIATSLNNLAVLYYSQGNYDQAELLHFQALELRQRLLEDNDPDIASSFNNLALLYESQGSYDLAEPLYLQALELFKRHMGENHPSIATSLNNLAFLYYSQGRYDLAEPLYLQALELRQRLLGDNHPDTATSLNNLAGLYESQGRYDQAETLFLQALEIRQKVFGVDHPKTVTVRQNLENLRANFSNS